MFEVATEVSLYYIIFGGIATRDIGRIPRQTLVHPDFGKNNGKIGLLGGFRVLKNSKKQADFTISFEKNRK